jgi:hypothetical protein
MVGLQQPLSKTFVKKGATNQQATGIWNVGIQFSKFRICKTYTCKDKLNIPKIKFICHRSIKIHLFWNKSIIIFSTEFTSIEGHFEIDIHNIFQWFVINFYFLLHLLHIHIRAFF